MVFAFSRAWEADSLGSMSSVHWVFFNSLWERMRRTSEARRGDCLIPRSSHDQAHR